MNYEIAEKMIFHLISIKIKNCPANIGHILFKCNYGFSFFYIYNDSILLLYCTDFAW